MKPRGGKATPSPGVEKLHNSLHKFQSLRVQTISNSPKNCVVQYNSPRKKSRLLAVVLAKRCKR